MNLHLHQLLLLPIILPSMLFSSLYITVRMSQCAYVYIYIKYGNFHHPYKKQSTSTVTSAKTNLYKSVWLVNPASRAIFDYFASHCNPHCYYSPSCFCFTLVLIDVRVSIHNTSLHIDVSIYLEYVYSCCISWHSRRFSIRTWDTTTFLLGLFYAD